MENNIVENYKKSMIEKYDNNKFVNYDLTGLSDDEKKKIIMKIFAEQKVLETNNGRKRLHVPMKRKGTSRKKRSSKKVIMIDETHLLFNIKEIRELYEAYDFPLTAIRNMCKRSRKHSNHEEAKQWPRVI